MEKHLETQPFMSRRTQHFLEGERIHGSIIPAVFCAAPLLLCALQDVQIVENFFAVKVSRPFHFPQIHIFFYLVFVNLSTKKFCIGISIQNQYLSRAAFYFSTQLQRSESEYSVVYMVKQHINCREMSLLVPAMWQKMKSDQTGFQ